jgi:hypothetical protein
MTAATPCVTVYFNESRGSRFVAYTPTADMQASRYYVKRRLTLEIPASATTSELAVAAAIAEAVFAAGNRDDRPNGRYERSISVGDVIVVHGPGYLSPSRRFAVETDGCRLLSDDEWPPRPTVAPHA